MSVTNLFASKALILKITGFWPNECDKRPYYSWLKTFSALVAFSIFSVLQVIGILTVATSENLFEHIIDCLGFLTLSARTYNLVVNRKSLLKLYIETCRFENIVYSSREKSTIEFWNKCRNTCVKYLVLGYPFVILSYAVTPQFSSDQVLPIKLMSKTNGLTSPWYEIIYVTELAMFAWALCNLASGDIYYVTFMCQICKELKLIKLLMTDDPSRNTNEIFRMILKRHSKIMEYGDTACEILSGTFFTQHCFLYMMICLCSFIATTTDNPAVLNKMLICNVVAGTMAFSVCLVGEILSSVSEGVVDAFAKSDLRLYEMNKPNDLRSLKKVSFFLLRAQKPLRLSVGTFGLMNLQFFSSSVKGIFSFIILLRTVYE